MTYPTKVCLFDNSRIVELRSCKRAVSYGNRVQRLVLYAGGSGAVSLTTETGSDNSYGRNHFICGAIENDPLSPLKTSVKCFACFEHSLWETLSVKW